MAKRIVNHAGGRRPLAPSSTIWSGVTGIYFTFDKVDAEALVAGGVLREDEVPGVRYKCAFNGERVKVHRCRDGSVNARIDADVVLSRDVPFKRFLGDLLSDTRLSLLRGESA